MSAFLDYFRSSTPPPPPRTDSHHPAISSPSRHATPTYTASHPVFATATQEPATQDSYWKNTKSTNIWVTLATPCLTFGRTRQRLIDLDNGESGLGDALRREGIAACMECFGTSLFGGWGFYIAQERRHIRHRLGIPGSQLRDFVGSCLCPCPSVQEHERTVFEYCIENAVITQPTPTLPMTLGDPGNRSSFITIQSSIFATPRESNRKSGPSNRERSISRSEKTNMTGSRDDDLSTDDEVSIPDPQIYSLCTSGNASEEDFLARVKADALSIVGDAFDSASLFGASAIGNGGGTLFDYTRFEHAIVAAASSTDPEKYKSQNPMPKPSSAAVLPSRRIPRSSNRPPARRAYSATFSISTIEEEDSDDTIVVKPPSRNQARDTWPSHFKPASSPSASLYAGTPSLRRKPRFTENDLDLETSHSPPTTHIARQVSVRREPDMLVQQIEIHQRGRSVQTPITSCSIRDSIGLHPLASNPTHPEGYSRAHSPLRHESELAARRNFFEAPRDRPARSSSNTGPNRRESTASNYSIGTKARLQAVRRRWHRRHVRAVSEPLFTFNKLGNVSAHSGETSLASNTHKHRHKWHSTARGIPCDVPDKHGIYGYDGTSGVSESVESSDSNFVASSEYSADADIESIETSSTDQSQSRAQTLPSSGRMTTFGHVCSMSVPEMGGRRLAQGLADREDFRETRERGFLRY